MKPRSTINKVFSLGVLFSGCLSVFLSALFFPFPVLDWQLLILSFVTIFFSSKLHFQLPKTKIHFSVGDVLILFAVLHYGGLVAVFLALCESLVTSYSFKRQGILIKPKTFALNAAIHTLSVFVTAACVYYLFDPVRDIVSGSHYDAIVLVMLTITVTQYAGNTVLVAIFTAERTGKSAWKIWNETFVNLGLLYIAESVLAVIAYKFITQTNLFMMLVVFGLGAVVYGTYRRYVDEIKSAAAAAEEAEHNRAESEKLRAEQAENHISELRKLLDEQERIGSELLESKNQFWFAAYHDVLTDLPNRNSAVEHLSLLLELSKSEAQPKFTVLSLDLNNFKHVNDSLGYSFGNEVLKQVAKRLLGVVGERGIVVRFGSDEFAVILDENSNEGDAVALAGIIYEKISQPFGLHGRQIFTSPSIGIAVSSQDYKLAEEILRDAEIAMYQAKQMQKRLVIFDRSMHDSLIERIEIETDLRQAIELEEFCLYFQPIVDLENVRISGFEALVRWNHPLKGLVAPDKFIPVAENTGLIIPMTEWILREACRQVKKWQTRYDADLTISVNISGKHFAGTSLIGLVQQILRETKFAPAKLKLEITESAVMEDAEKAISILKELKNLGVKLMIDDFGTGYSSLNYLHKFPIDTLKVDRSFVGTMENEDENHEIVSTIISMAKNLRLDVVAEGIETINQFFKLQKLGCEKGQGYFFSKPVPPKQIENLLKNTELWQEIRQTREISYAERLGAFDADNLAATLENQKICEITAAEN